MTRNKHTQVYTIRALATAPEAAEAIIILPKNGGGGEVEPGLLDS